MSNERPYARIALIHALQESIAPAHSAFAKLWPEAYCFDLLDTSLAADRAERDDVDASMVERFRELARYATASNGRGGQTAGVLFTCSAFGHAINAVKSVSTVPVLNPNEASFDAAMSRGCKLGLVVTFKPSLAALEGELEAAASVRGKTVKIKSAFAEGALAALKRGDGRTHDRLAAEAAATIGDVDAIILGQFSLARAKGLIGAATRKPVITTPHSAVDALRKMVFARAAGDAALQTHRGTRRLG